MNAAMVARLLAAVVLALGCAACSGGETARESEPVEVPRVVGLSTEEATARLGAHGLCVGTISWGAYSPASAGRVLEQSPRAGLRVASGASVSIVIAPASPSGDIVEAAAPLGCAAPTIRFPKPG